MTREQQIKHALKILDPPAQHRDACIADIEAKLELVRTASFAVMVAKTHSIGDIKYMTDLMVAKKEAPQDQIKPVRKAWAAYHKAARQLRGAHTALAVLGRKGPLSMAAIEQAIEESAERGPALRELFNHKQEYAVDVAHELLTQWTSNKIVTTKDGDWWRLAAVLYGDEHANLFRHLRTHEIRAGQK